ncbi:MAG TPA: alanine racemase [Armatimonadota bacterium]|jgi:diaminopimelate decarboxylase
MLEHFLAGGEFQIEGLALDQILAGHPTPVYAYSAARVRANLRRVQAHLPGFEVFYSLKPNPSLALCGVLARAGSSAEVSSLGELQTAVRAGFRPEQILLVGPVKTPEEIAFAVEQGVYALVAESAQELAGIETEARRAGRRVRVLLRVNTESGPEAPEVMVGGPSKFGFDEETLVEEVRQVDLRAAYLGGFQVYAASQVLDAAWIAGHFAHVSSLARELAERLGFAVECLDFGGGFGVPYTPDDPELDLEVVAAAAERVRQEWPAPVRLVVELGRYLVADAGVYLTRVVRVKQSRGVGYVITDGGMHGFSRPAFMRTEHPIRIVSRPAAPPTGPFRVCGRCCTPLDVLGEAVPLPLPAPGEVLGVFNAGAYGLSMSLVGFMSFGAPAELLVDGGAVRVIQPARGPSDLLAGQTL